MLCKPDIYHAPSPGINRGNGRKEASRPLCGNRTLRILWRGRGGSFRGEESYISGAKFKNLASESFPTIEIMDSDGQNPSRRASAANSIKIIK